MGLTKICHYIKVKCTYNHKHILTKGSKEFKQVAIHWPVFFTVGNCQWVDWFCTLLAIYSTITRNNSKQHLSSTCKTIFCTKLVKTKTAPLTNPFHHTNYYNNHLLHKKLFTRPKKFHNHSYVDLKHIKKKVCGWSSCVGNDLL